MSRESDLESIGIPRLQKRACIDFAKGVLESTADYTGVCYTACLLHERLHIAARGVSQGQHRDSRARQGINFVEGRATLEPVVYAQRGTSHDRVGTSLPVSRHSVDYNALLLYSQSCAERVLRCHRGCSHPAKVTGQERPLARCLR